MPRQKDLNRLVRARMNKTGEAYTAARANVVKNKRSVRSENSGWVAEADRAAAPRPSEYAHLAGMSDARDGTYEVSKSRTLPCR